MKYTKKVPYFKKGDKVDKFDKAFKKLPKEQKEAILKVSSAQKEQERKDSLSSVGAGFRRPTAKVITPADTRSKQIKSTVGKKAAKTRGQAFQAARERGDSEFPWKGNRYHTRTAEEEAKAAEEAAAKEAAAREAAAREQTVAPVAPVATETTAVPEAIVTTAVTEVPATTELSDEELQAALANSGTGWLDVDPLSSDEVASKILIDAQQYLAKNPQQKRADYRQPPTPTTTGDMSWFMRSQSNNIPRYGISQRPNNLSTPMDPIIDAEGNPVAVEQSPLSFQDPEYIKKRLSMYSKEVGLQPFADPSYDEPMYIDFKGNIFGMKEVLEGLQTWENNRRIPSAQEIYDQEVRYRPTAMDTSTAGYRQGGNLPAYKQGGQIPKFQQGDKLHLRNIWERMFGITPDYTPVNSQESITSYMDNTHKGPVEKRVIRKEVPYANLHSTMSIRNPGTNRADTTFTTPSGTRYDMNDVRSGKAPSGYSYKFFRKPAGYFQQGGNIENKQAALIADFVVRYLKGLGVPEENIISSDGSLNQEHVPAVQEVLAEIGDSAEFWSMYEQNPDEVISQYIQSKNPGAAQMARKGAKLKRLSQIRMHFRGGPTPYVSDFKRASDKKIAWSEKYGQDDLSGVERRDSQMSTPMPESIRAKQELLSNSRRGLLRNTTINPKFNNPRFNFNKYLLKR